MTYNQTILLQIADERLRQGHFVKRIPLYASAALMVGLLGWVVWTRLVVSQPAETLPSVLSVGPANVVDIMPFTDAKMHVLEVYKGATDNNIAVMQMGGELPAADGDPAINYVMLGDPIFVPGSEHILFLKDISDDPVHNKGKNQRLYRLVNPAGRYEIQGDRVINYFSAEAPLPATLGELLSQIQQAVLNQTP